MAEKQIQKNEDECQIAELEMEGEKKRQDSFIDFLLQWQVAASGTELS